MKRLILRADDLGFSEGVNCGIERSVRDGLIRNVGIMTNMPAAPHGVELLSGLPVCFGQHTNICAGRPLTDPKLIPSITNANGEFKSSKVYRSAKEDFVVLDEVILEIEAQYRRFKELTGQEPSYFEGHAVASANFFKGLAIVAGRHGLRYLGLSLDGPVSFGHSRLYMHMESMQPDYDPMESMRKMKFHEGEDEADIFICHPGYLDAYIMKASSLLMPRVLEVEMLTGQELKDYISAQNIQNVTFDDV